MNANSTLERYKWIDLAKGLVMILTVYMHCGLSGVPFVGEWVNAFFMPLFFFVSGILLKPEKYTLLLFIKRRWLTLYRPYILFSIIMLGLSYPFVGGGNPLIHIQSILSNGWGGYALWFIPVLAFAELLYVVLCKATINPRIKSIMLLLSMFVGYYLYILQPSNQYNWSLIFTALGFYGLGNLLKQVMVTINGRTLWSIVVISFILSLTCLLNSGRPEWFVNILASFWTYPAALGGTIFICLFCKCCETYIHHMVVTTLNYIGRNTYVILAFHQVTMQLLTKSELLPNGTSVRITMWIIMIILIECINRFVPQILGHKK